MNKIDTFAEDGLIKLRDAVSETLTAVRKSTVKKKFKIIGKSLLSTVIVAGGITVAVLFPSPITLAVLGGAAALIGGNNGVLRDIRTVRKDSARTQTGKKDFKTLNSELNNRKTTREVLDAVSKQTQLPSAPPIYPSLQYQ